MITPVHHKHSTPSSSRASESRKIKIYDFARPDKFNKNQIRTMCSIHERLARLMSSFLSKSTVERHHCHVASVDQLTLDEFIRSVPTPTTIAIINIVNYGPMLMEVDPAVTQAYITNLLGMTDLSKIQHELTEIEATVMKAVFTRLLPLFTEAWSPIANLDFEFSMIETNPQFVKLDEHTLMTCNVTLEARSSEMEGMINILYPDTTLINLMKVLDNEKTLSTPEVTPIMDDLPMPLLALLKTPVLTIRELLTLKTGTILPISSHTVDLCSINKVLYHGVIGKVNGKRAIKLIKPETQEPDFQEGI